MGYIGAGPTRFNTADELTVTGDAEFNGNLTVKGTTTTIDSVTVQNFDMGDNDRIRIGDSQDLQIYHDGSNSYIYDGGAGNLIIKATDIRIRTATDENYITATQDGALSLYYDNAAKLATTATGVDVTGGLNTTGNVGIATTSPATALTVASEGKLRLYRSDNARYGDIYNDNSFFNIETSNDPIKLDGQSYIRFDVAADEKMRIDSSGNVGIGGSPSAKLSVNDANGIPIHMGDISAAPTSQTAAYVGVSTSSLTGGNGDLVLAPRTSDARSVVFYTGNGTSAERMRIDSSGSVGIGTVSPARKLHIAGSHIRVDDGYGLEGSGSTDKFVINNNYLTMFTNSAERMRIDSSGNLLVSKTSDDNTTVGGAIRNTGVAAFVADGNHPLIINRKTSDGDLISLRKDSSNVGSIGTVSGKIYIGSSAGGDTFLRLNSNTVTPANSSGADRDATINLGYSGGRFKDLFLSGTVTADSLTIQSRNLTNNGYPVVEHSATAPSSPVDGQLWWDNSSDNLSIYKNSTAKWISFALKPDGSSAAQAITSTSQVVSSIGTNFTQGVYYINTPDGGVQQAYLMYAENHVWFLVGRFAASAASTVTNTLDSARSMIDVTQNGASKWSADFGSAFAEDVMIWGATDFPNQTGHTVNWVYQIGGATTLRSFFAGTTGDNSSTSNYTLPQRSGQHGSAKHSLYCENGARDGVFKGSRWTNNAMRYVLVSDAPTTCYTNPSGLSAPTNSMFYWDGAQDAKMSVTYSGDTVGQDYGNTSQMFGRDDSNTSFVDAGASTVNTNNPQGSYSSAVTIWARLH